MSEAEELRETEAAEERDIPRREVVRGLLLGSGMVAGAFLGLGKGAAEPQVAAAATTDVQGVSVKDYGAVGDRVADDTAAINAAITAAAAGGKPILFPAASGYRTTNTIQVPLGIDVIMDAPIVLDSSSAVTALAVGQAGKSNKNRTMKVQVVRARVSDWSNEGAIGVKIMNASACDIQVVEATGFTIGLQFIGSGGGFSYNNVRLGTILNNKVALDLTNESINGAIGWCNENHYTGGRFTVQGVNLRKARFGVRITSKDGTYLTNNNNVFLKPSFELSDVGASPEEAVPILIENGHSNHFLECRNEANSPAFARVLNQSRQNVVTLGYSQGSPMVDDKSQFPTTRMGTVRGDLMDNAFVQVFESGPMHKNAVYYDATRVNVPKVNCATTGSNTSQRAASGITVASRYLEVTAASGVGIFLDTTGCKRFVVRRDVEAGYGGRVSIVCYDAAGAIRGAWAPKGYPDYLFYYQSTFGGSWQARADSDKDVFFSVAPEVCMVRIICTGGTNPLRIRSFSIYAADNRQVSSWTGYEEIVPGAGIAVGPPPKGTYGAGKMVYNPGPKSGSPIGWICVTGGTPGTWRPFGQVL